MRLLEHIRTWAVSFTEAGKYSPVGVWFHWIMAAIVLYQLFSGWMMQRYDVGGDKLEVYARHSEIGLSLLLLAILRALWRLFIPDPINAADMQGWKTTAAHATHFAFYVLFAVLPLSGWCLWSAVQPARPLYLAGLVRIPPMPFYDLSPAWQYRVLDLAEDVHVVGVMCTYCWSSPPWPCWCCTSAQRSSTTSGIGTTWCGAFCRKSRTTRAIPNTGNILGKRVDLVLGERSGRDQHDVLRIAVTLAGAPGAQLLCEVERRLPDKRGIAPAGAASIFAVAGGAGFDPALGVAAQVKRGRGGFAVEPDRQAGFGHGSFEARVVLGHADALFGGQLPGDPAHVHIAPLPIGEEDQLAGEVAGIEARDARRQIAVSLSLKPVAGVAGAASTRIAARERDQFAGFGKARRHRFGRTAHRRECKAGRGNGAREVSQCCRAHRTREHFPKLAGSQ